MPAKIVYCQATYADDFDGTLKCVELAHPYVDHVIIVEDGSLTEEQKAKLRSYPNLILKTVAFHDSLPMFRNAYLEEAKKLGADWCAISDPDEFYSEPLLQNLRAIIEEAEAEGYNMLPIHVRDQFESVEWLDDLDLLKEVPGGYRETDYWKPLLLFKLQPDTRYVGVGVTKTVHESLESSIPWRAKNLPKELFYTHEKSALKIWRNAARNLVMGGAGDNVGDLNPYWTRLRQIMTVLGINTWKEFEDCLKKGNVDSKLKTWLIDALQAPPTRWGTETRETAKYYWALHPEEVTDDVRRRIEEPPKLTPEGELESYITRCYYQILHRHPDEYGLKGYAKAILEGKITREQLPALLKSSLEYHEKFGPEKGVEEKVRVQVPVDVDVRINKDAFITALMKSRVYWETIKPQLDIGEFVELFVSDKKEFQEWFYKNREELTFDDLAGWIREHGIHPNSIAACIMGYHEVLPMILESVETVRPYVDEIHVQGDNFTQEDVETLKKLGCEVHFEPWKDDFSDYKNKCISHAKSKWTLILDHDEIPTPEMASNLREIVQKSDFARVYNIVEFESINQTVNKDGKVISESRGRGKPLLHIKVSDPYYGNPHIWLKPNYPWRTGRVPLAYGHVKEEGVDLPRSVRNVFLGGGGDNTREGNPLWVELRRLTKELNVDTWKEFHDYLKKGNVDPRLLNVMKRLAEMPWKDDELKDIKRYYLLLHSEEEERFNAYLL